MEQRNIKIIEGVASDAAQASIAVVASRFNELIVEQLLKGALDTLIQHGVEPERITVVRVPGAWELPGACLRLAKAGKVQGIVAIGCVIRGGTPHFDYVAGEATRGLAQVILDTGVPIALGVLTTNTLEQAIERADSMKCNRGADAALALLQMVGVHSALERTRLV